MGQGHDHMRPEPAPNHEHAVAEPELFSWFEPAEGEHYVAIEQELLDVIRKIAEHHHAQTTLMLRVARVDRTSGRVVFGVRIRDLDRPEGS
jgi:hypothetical protein